MRPQYVAVSGDPVRSRDLAERAGVQNRLHQTLEQVNAHAARRAIERGRPDPDASGTEEYRIGRMIGILERFLIIDFALYGRYGAIGLVLAAKSVARLEDLQSRTFAEYDLLGTLMSTPEGLGTARALRGAWKLF